MHTGAEAVAPVARKKPMPKHISRGKLSSASAPIADGQVVAKSR
jgi:hypothetical protein